MQSAAAARPVGDVAGGLWRRPMRGLEPAKIDSYATLHGYLSLFIHEIFTYIKLLNGFSDLVPNAGPL